MDAQKKATLSPVIMTSHVDETVKVRGEELPKRLFALDHYPIRKRINASSDPEYLTSIMSALKGTKEMDFLLKSCFGHLFLISPSKMLFSGKLVHTFMCRQIVTKKKHEIWIVFAGQPIKFSLREFGIVTGLPCGKYPENNVVEGIINPKEGSTTVWDSLFGKDCNPTIEELVAMLGTNVDWPGWKKLAVSLIIIVDGILTPKSMYPRPCSKTVEMTKDLEFFCKKFPWGRMSYELTYENICGFIDVESIVELRSRLKQKTITVHGFPLALQLLAFEALPSLKTLLSECEDDPNFVEQPIQRITKLKLIYTSDIMKCEEDQTVVVHSIIHADDPPCIDSLTWDDEVVDSQVVYMESLIKGEHKFDNDVWLGGDDSCPKLKRNKTKDHEVAKGRIQKGRDIIELRRTNMDGCTQNSGGENIEGDMEAGMDKSLKIGLRRSPRMHGPSTVHITDDSQKRTVACSPNKKRKKSGDIPKDHLVDEQEPTVNKVFSPCLTKHRKVEKNKIHKLSRGEDGEEQDVVERVTKRKEVGLFNLLVNSVWEKGGLEEDELESSPEDQSEEEDQRKYDDGGLLIIRPPTLNLRFGVEEPKSPPVLSESEIEEAKLWEEMAFSIQSNNIGGIEHFSDVGKEIPNDETPRERCRKGTHELCLDLEIGMKCIHCSFVEREIRGIDVAEWGNKNTTGRRNIGRSEMEEGSSSSFLEKLGFEASIKNSLNGGCVISSEGTVWDKILGTKAQMYPHQQEGFEFIWKNLAGTIMLNELKNFENSDETGGCIISHAPGTGKTRLTIIFLQAYLECFPDCKPLIIAPASLLLTWEEEFKKWNTTTPFHNLSSLDFNGNEDSRAVNLLMQKNSSARSKNEKRMVKIYSWIKEKSILGVSYHLYEKLAGVVDKKRKRAREAKPEKELDDIREIIMKKPGLLVLDEAHTPRNQRSCIWKTLSKVETQKRIMLSGTPFQNNFQELCNVLGLARPKYLERLQSTLKKSGMAVTKRGRKGLGDGVNNRGIEELKAVMLPFVHVHKGSILQSSLPGLRECVVVLNPPELQKRVLESIEVTQNVFQLEHKLSLVSVHPSLVSHCTLSANERLSMDEALLAQLKKIRLDPMQSVKTRFLMEFIGLCDKLKEKVLVFSQFIDPLELIIELLVSRFKWNEGEEVMYMHGKLDQKQRQTLINEFNDPNSKARVLLASTKACSEGISLVGASRVILLDVVWNPAVERQAISRAYRIGQEMIVYTYHLVAKGTLEGTKYCKQAEKDRISELVFACSSKHDEGKEKIDEAVREDKVLDTMVNHMRLMDMFDNLIVQPREADLVEGFNNILMP